jgi:amidophosphoribosyltransferase
VLDSAKEAILKGVAGEKEINIVKNGFTVTHNGQVEPALRGITNGNGINGNGINGDSNGHERRKREREDDSTAPVRDRHDIRYVVLFATKRQKVDNMDSLHNFADEPRRGYE